MAPASGNSFDIAGILKFQSDWPPSNRRFTGETPNAPRCRAMATGRCSSHLLPRALRDVHRVCLQQQLNCFALQRPATKLKIPHLSMGACRNGKLVT